MKATTRSRRRIGVGRRKKVVFALKDDAEKKEEESRALFERTKWYGYAKYFLWNYDADPYRATMYSTSLALGFFAFPKNLFFSPLISSKLMSPGFDRFVDVVAFVFVFDRFSKMAGVPPGYEWLIGSISAWIAGQYEFVPTSIRIFPIESLRASRATRSPKLFWDPDPSLAYDVVVSVLNVAFMAAVSFVAEAKYGGFLSFALAARKLFSLPRIWDILNVLSWISFFAAGGAIYYVSKAPFEDGNSKTFVPLILSYYVDPKPERPPKTLKYVHFYLGALVVGFCVFFVVQLFYLVVVLNVVRAALHNST